MNSKVRVGIIGGAGYTGGETLRLLVHHPNVEIVFVHSRSNTGKSVTQVHADLQGDTNLFFSNDLRSDVDVLFLCLGHGESRKFLEEEKIDKAVRIIDLSQDFRLGEKSGERVFIYGLPELNRESLRRAHNVANPGCFATAIQLGLLPLAADGKLAHVFTTGITGSTGAGQKLQDTTHFSWRANNISAYKTLSHQHLREINRSLRQLQPADVAVDFVPWRGDFARGIFVSSCVESSDDFSTNLKRFQKFYEGHPFAIVTEGTVDMKQVVNTNKCLIGLEQVGNKLVVHTAIDNLLKGASGQAVQNMNLMFGLDEKSGLQLKSIVF